MSIVMTVSRELGSQGSYVAAAVAEQLGLRYLDREILHRAAEVAGFPDEQMINILEQQERVPGFLSRMFDSLNAMPSVPVIASASIREGYYLHPEIANLVVEEQARQERREAVGDTYIDLMGRVLREYATKGDVIIVGRGGQIVLRDYARVLHVRIQAPVESRTRNIIKRQKISYDVASELVKESDRMRARYIKRYYYEDWANPALYDIIVNTNRMSVQMAAHFICAAAQWLAENGRV
ncbi:MAG: cytidylate kinase-like family protein [Anaerolineae bacterium]|nr:cytidylate kinase-like family protein [Anaerolineae bacterium]